MSLGFAAYQKTKRMDCPQVSNLFPSMPVLWRLGRATFGLAGYVLSPVLRTLSSRLHEGHAYKLVPAAAGPEAPMNHMVLMGKRLKALRKQQGFKTQKEFAAHAALNNFHIDWRRYGAIERGDVKADIQEVLMICLLMRISADAWILNKTFHQIPGINALTEDELNFLAGIVRLMTAKSPR